jgi:hypothetical protein
MPPYLPVRYHTATGIQHTATSNEEFTFITTTSELDKVYNINGAPQQWNEMRAELTINKVFPSAATAMCWPSPLNARQRTGELQNTIHRWKINIRQLQWPQLEK